MSWNAKLALETFLTLWELCPVWDCWNPRPQGGPSCGGRALRYIQTCVFTAATTLLVKAEHCIHKCTSHRLTTHTYSIKATTLVSSDNPRDNFDVGVHKWGTTPLRESAVGQRVFTIYKENVCTEARPPTTTTMLLKDRAKASSSTELTHIWTQCRTPQST